MPRTPAQFEEIREARRAAILDAALHVFAEKGYASSSIAMIAKQAGISKGLMYNYFDSKEGLVKTLLTEGFDIFVEVFDRDKDGELTDEEFIFFLDQTFEILKGNIPFWKLYFAIMSQADVMSMLGEVMMEKLSPYFNTMQNYYAQKGYENPMAQMRVLGALLDGVCLNYVADPEGFPLEDAKKIIIDKFI